MNTAPEQVSIVLYKDMFSIAVCTLCEMSVKSVWHHE